MNGRSEENLLADVVESAVGALPGPFALLAPFAERLTRKVQAERKRNTSVALRAAEWVSGKSREDLAEEIADRPELVPLLTRLLHAAGMNGHDDVLEALGTAFGDAVKEPSKVGEAELILEVLEGLTADHIRVLRVLITAPQDARDRGWRASEIAGHEMSLNTALICVATLGARGLAQELQGFGGTPGLYGITDTGLIVLDAVDEARRAREADKSSAT